MHNSVEYNARQTITIFTISTNYCFLLAGDTNSFLHDSDSTKLFSRANICMFQLCEWFKVNELSLNFGNTCYSIFGPTHKNLNDKVIQNVASCKYLGILIDSDL